MPKDFDIKGWSESWDLSASMFREANVYYEFI